MGSILSDMYDREREEAAELRRRSYYVIELTPDEHDALINIVKSMYVPFHLPVNNNHYISVCYKLRNGGTRKLRDE